MHEINSTGKTIYAFMKCHVLAMNFIKANFLYTKNVTRRGITLRIFLFHVADAISAVYLFARPIFSIIAVGMKHIQHIAPLSNIAS
jgi:hypothetical protein